MRNVAGKTIFDHALRPKKIYAYKAGYTRPPATASYSDTVVLDLD
jgi:hypothetical protein